MFYESIHDFLFNVMSQFYMTGVIEAAQDYILRDEGYKNSVVSLSRKNLLMHDYNLKNDMILGGFKNSKKSLI